ncbi:hypothetical protein BDN70DRAFT_962709 [Pholiota conissans]|uniref:Uncharacterized protein n=1 Tax=Pholiota conissans TaxID=109636 RepID=A0A9P5YQI0_9AGAR|nr:hypothetical protein BDN70DRAFT_962709 [Pholiota conissans]
MQASISSELDNREARDKCQSIAKTNYIVNKQLIKSEVNMHLSGETAATLPPVKGNNGKSASRHSEIAFSRALRASPGKFECVTSLGAERLKSVPDISLKRQIMRATYIRHKLQIAKIDEAIECGERQIPQRFAEEYDHETEEMSTPKAQGVIDTTHSNTPVNLT